MNLIICDPADEARIITQRRDLGHDRLDEVWNGVYVISPLANNEHQQIIGRFSYCFDVIITNQGLGIVQPGANVRAIAP